MMRRSVCAGELRLDAPATAAAASRCANVNGRMPHMKLNDETSSAARGNDGAAAVDANGSGATLTGASARAAAAVKNLERAARRQNVLAMKMYSCASGVGESDKSRMMPATVSVRSTSRGGPNERSLGPRAARVATVLPPSGNTPHGG